MDEGKWAHQLVRLKKHRELVYTPTKLSMHPTFTLFWTRVYYIALYPSPFLFCLNNHTPPFHFKQHQRQRRSWIRKEGREEKKATLEEEEEEGGGGVGSWYVELSTRFKKGEKKKKTWRCVVGEVGRCSPVKVHQSQRAAKMLLRGNPDSDDSISDEDNHDFPNTNNVVSFQDDATKKQQELPLPVRLDLLKERTCNQTLTGKGTGSSSSFDKPLEDEEVEMPDFKEGDFRDVSGEVVADSSDEEIVSEDEGSTVLSTRHLHKYGPRFIRNDQVKDTNRKSEALLNFKESASRSASHATCSKANTSGIWSKAKPRFSLSSVSHKYGLIGPSISNIDRLPETIKAVDPGASSSLDGNHLEDDDSMEIKSDTEPAETEALPHEYNLPSISDLFDNLQDNTDSYFPHDSRRVKKVQLFQKNSRSHLPETVVDSEDSPEPVDSRSSSDNEVSDQHMKITFVGKKMQTMADRFQEALGSSSVITEGSHVGALNSLRGGIFEKLQQVMLKEKERDMDFWKKLQAGARPDSELGCIDVKIISRYLDGKLTVCHCSFGKYTENFLLQAEGMGFGGSKSGQRTIIFSPRVCDNVDLEVGSLIRIHPPWKEVQVGNDDIILCTYFSEISSPV